MIRVKNGKAVANLSRKSFGSNKTRNLIAAIAIALTALLFTSLFTMGIGTVENLQRGMMRQAGGDGHAVLKYITPEQFDAVRDDPAIEKIAFDMPLCDSVENAELIKRHTEFWYYDSVGLELGFIKLDGGRLPEKENEVIADSKTLELMGVPLEEGAEIRLDMLVHGESVERTLVLSGWWQSDPLFNVGQIFSSRAYVDAHPDELKNTYREDFSMAGVINAYIMFHNSSDLNGKLEELLVRNGFSLDENEPNYVSSNVNWCYLSTNFELDAQTLIIMIVGLLLIILTGYLIIYNIFQISVVKDIRFYGLLKTIGTTSRQIRRIIRRQALTLCVFGIPVGLVLGFFCGTTLVPLLIENSSYAGGRVSVAPNPYIFIGAALFALLTVLISTLKPANMAGRVSPIEAVRYSEADAGTKRAEKKSTGGAKMHRMALSNLGRNKKRTALVITSFSLCLVLLCAVATISVSIDMDKFISRFNDSDFLIANAEFFNNDYYGTENQLSGQMIEAVKALDGFESGGAVYGGRENGFATADPNYKEQYNINSYGHALSAVYGLDGLALDNLKLIDGELDMEKLRSGDYILEGVHVDDNGRPHMDEIHFGVGEKVTIGNYYGDDTESFAEREYRTHEYTVLGHVEVHSAINSDGLRDEYTYYLPLEAFEKIVKNPAVMNYSFNIAEDREDAAESFLKDYCDNVEPMMNFTSKTATKTSFEGIRNTVTMVGGALGGVIGLIGILNFINAVLTGIISRRKEFAMLQSIGMTRAQLRKMLCFEGVYYAAISGAASIVVGIIFSALVVRAACNSLWFMSYRLVVWPLFAAIPVLLALGALIPLIIFGASGKDTIVERLREAE